MNNRIIIPVTEEWKHMYEPSYAYLHTKRPFERLKGKDDFVNISKPYSEICGEPVWCYSWGNCRWLRCPIGIPGDRLNDFGDRIVSVDVRLIRNRWMFVISVEEGTT